MTAGFSGPKSSRDSRETVLSTDGEVNGKGEGTPRDTFLRSACIKLSAVMDISVANDLRSSHHIDKHATLDSVRCAHDQGNSAIIGVVVVEYILFAETNCGANQVSSDSRFLLFLKKFVDHCEDMATRWLTIHRAVSM